MHPIDPETPPDPFQRARSDADEIPVRTAAPRSLATDRLMLDHAAEYGLPMPLDPIAAARLRRANADCMGALASTFGGGR